MATNQTSQVIQHLRRQFLQDEAGLTDGQLLGCFIDHRDEAAFAALVQRHGQLVWNVCRRLLGQQDAEDAFQATFLVLCRKAASIRRRERLPSWLYGVAHRTALQARRAAARRRNREKQVVDLPEPAVVEQDLWNDLRPLLDQELSRLPEAYRGVVILCDLEGKARKEVARQLGLPEGTVASRLARARAMLAKRLARHGLVVSAGALEMVLSQRAAEAGVPTSVVSNTIKAASLVAAGQAGAAGAISLKVAALTEGVMQTMLLTKLKNLTVAALAVVALAAAATILLASRTTAGEQNEAAAPLKEIARSDGPKEWKGTKDAKQNTITIHAQLEEVDARNNTITVTDVTRLIGLLELEAKKNLALKEKKEAFQIGDFLRDPAKEKQKIKLENLPLAHDARIMIDGKEINVASLKAGMILTLHLAATGQRGLEVVGIQKYEMPRVETKPPKSREGRDMLVEAPAPLPWANKIFEETTKDFGTHTDGKDLLYRFKITNIYAVPLHLSSLKASCGCVACRLSKENLEPRETGFLEVTMDTRKFSGRKTVTIHVLVSSDSYCSGAVLTVSATNLLKQ